MADRSEPERADARKERDTQRLDDERSWHEMPRRDGPGERGVMRVVGDPDREADDGSGWRGREVAVEDESAEAAGEVTAEPGSDEEQRYPERDELTATARGGPVVADRP